MVQFRYKHLMKLGDHQLIIPVYVPGVLLEHAEALGRCLHRSPLVELSVPKTTYSIPHEDERDNSDRFVILREHRTNHGCLELAIRIATDDSTYGREPAYRMPQSKEKPSEGIYFSEQDSVRVELELKTNDGGKVFFCGVGERIPLYQQPRLVYLNRSGIHVTNPLVRRIHDLLITRKSELPESRWTSLAHVQEGIKVLELLVDVYHRSLQDVQEQEVVVPFPQ